MAIENGNLVLFTNGTQSGYEGLSTKLDNTFYITSDTNNLYLGENLIGSNVKDASYSDDKLVITLVSGTNVELDFSDIASATATGTAIGDAIATAISTAKAEVIGEDGDEWSEGNETLYALKAKLEGTIAESGVTSLNELTGDVEIVNGDNVTVATVDGKIQISSSYTDTDTILTAVAAGTYVGGSSTGTTLTIDDSALSNKLSSIDTEINTKIDTVVVDGDDSDFISTAITRDDTNDKTTLTITVDGIQDAIGDAIDGYTVPSYTIGTTTTTSGYASTYQLFKDNVAVADSIINIPKDQFLSGATIVTGTVTDGVFSSEGTSTYIKLEFQVSGDGIDPGTIYLNVEDLCDVYTGGAGITISNNVVDLDVATATTLGGVKIGTNISIDENGVISSTDTNTVLTTVTTTDYVSGTVTDGTTLGITLDVQEGSEDFIADITDDKLAAKSYVDESVAAVQTSATLTWSTF